MVPFHDGGRVPELAQGRRCGPGWVRGLALATVLWVGVLTPGVAGAQEDFEVSRFDTETEAYAWTRWWGAAGQIYEFDAGVDAGGSTASGSLKAMVDFDFGSFGTDNQFAARADFPGGATLDGTQFTNLTFRLRWSVDSPKNADGNFGYLEYGFRNSDWSQTWLGGQTIAGGSGDTWLTVNAPIAPTLPKLDTIAGVVLKLWSGNAGGLSGTTVFWVDDIVLQASKSTEPPPRPSLAMLPATSGLRLAASSQGAQYQRQNVRTQAADSDGNPHAYGWVGQSSPVTYSFTVKDYPAANHSGFQTHLFLVPEAGMPYGPGDNSIDWNAPNVVFVQLANQADGSAGFRFMIKTNLPSGNAMFWNTDPANGAVGTLATISDASPLGTWSVTFRNDTDVTLTTPSGTTTNFSLASEAVSLFAEPLYAYFGVQPNTMENIGQAATLSRISIAGVPTPLEDSFGGEALAAGSWAVVAADPPGLVVVPPTTRYWLTWAAPSAGYVVQSTADLKTWADPGLTGVFQIGPEKRALVPASALPSAGAGFFRLMKP